MEPTPGQLLRTVRKRRGVSQRRLAIRAGTTQSAISRIEADRVSPTVETLQRLLHLLGEELVLSARESNSGIDRSLIAERRKLTPSERIEYGRRFAQYVIDHSPNRRGDRAA